MFVKFLALEWKSLFRSANVGHSILIKTLLAFFALLFAIGLLAIGHSMYDILDESSDHLFPMQQVNRYLLVWFLSELGLRFFMQQLPILNIKPFLIQRISRDTLTHYLLSKSLFTFYNLLAPLLFIPFAIACWSIGDYSGLQILGWLVAVIGTSLSLHFFNFSIQQSLSAHWRLASIIVLVVAILILLDYLHVLSVSDQIAAFYELVLLHPSLAVLPILLIVVSYLLIYRSLRHQLYLEGRAHSRKNSTKTDDIRWIDQLGRYAPVIRLDLKLLWRNKRTKSLLTTAFFGLLYGLLFYNNSSSSSQGMLVFVGIFMTGLFTLNFGQFVPAWDSSYYSIIHTQRINIQDYLGAKSILLYISIIFGMILTIPYVYFGKEILMINLSTAVYNLGVNVPIILYFGTYNKKRVDLEKSQFFNYQGMGAAQWIMMLPALLIPVILWSIVQAFTTFETTCLIFVVLGMIGLCFRNVWLRIIARRYHARKYAMLEGFKQVGE
ncbi:DUF5687 family protein [Sphingobacterium corticibacter]|uniref:Uncharacterized protein n=1 Tax=Sphingobacterium corticibacter TaxID=2171749 RepID=A0A2T8HIW4_9SPHI|nr:DUF5687 family protein [Sphingobacterium corticibacter]PVH25381.1 hypothetical protein DC487_10720 [Sphingobacterium corticibacter]